MRIDETNISIIHHLKDGRTSFKKIADDLQLSEGTIRGRVKKLREEGVLEISGLVDPDAIPDKSIVIAGIKLKSTDLVSKGEEFTKLRGVTSVCVVTGRFDLVVTVLLDKEFGMLEFYTEEVSKIDDVRSVETFVVYKSFNLKVPLVV
ncbi:Lrp/AsnC family transcriptional regulator [Desulforhopalus singaporensis]|uniref:Lrp/AsnC family transcriptional regulator, regulator for asnA, asnC and gidA n=1 Tax=Desulforhopalus singaporensis TaxID=91360 RepID=A0A1H0PUL7_9BACT|nr:Lrp/AsnC family transcriptional regulator [Desulforhopalus singaporensis]SDP08256.1 Lrp/AsnC family transcriptional regulator, regulator for asnA, asnC and gidA [Desulforhopalus singaporensis]